MSFRVPKFSLPDWRRHLLRAANRLRQPGVVRALRFAPGELEHVKAGLIQFDECSGEEFVALSEALSNLNTNLVEIGTQAKELDDLLRGKDEDYAHASAFDLYKRSIDLAHASIGIALSQEEELGQLEVQLLANRSHFERNSLMFRLLVLNIRAEAAHVSETDRATFLAIADEMAAMEREMNQAVTRAFSELETIVYEATAGRSDLQKLQASLQENAQDSIKSLRSELDGLKHALIPCAEANQHITRLLAEIGGQSGDLITSLQYQDIVRQQMGHVIQGFEDMVSHLYPKRSARRQRIDLSYLHRASRIQTRQLKHARNAIQGAASAIGQKSQTLLGTGSELVLRFRDMENRAADVFSHSQLGFLLREETTRLVSIASQSEATNERISRLLDRIESCARVFCTEIVRHEFEVLLVALNAQIAAAHVPAAGALNKLAEETARLAQDTASLTRTMSSQLDEMLVRLREMRAEADRIRITIGREKTDLATRASDVGEKLGRLNTRIHTSSSNLRWKFNRAYGELQTVLTTLRFPVLIDRCFTPADSLSQRLDAATAHAAGDTTPDDRHLRAHAARYTMRRERELHAAVLSGSAPPPVIPPAAADDIELFDTPAHPRSAPPAPAAATADVGVELF